MTLVMFDIDGTLTESSDLDSATYVDALRDVFGFRDVSDHWASYPHATDSGILAELFRVRRERAPYPEEARAMEQRYVALLTERIAAAGGLRQVPGATEVLSRLATDPLYAVALASGAWRSSAGLKLRAAGLPVDRFPAAFSDDAPSRADICRISRQRAEEHYKQEFTRVVYVGDGVWDVRTSRQLGYGFIGVGNGDGAGKLFAEGAQQVTPHFKDVDALLSLLASSETPAPQNHRSP